MHEAGAVRRRDSFAMTVRCHGAQSGERPTGRATECGMTVESIVIFLLISAVAGWLAGVVVKGGGFGLVGDIVVGILGAFVAGGGVAPVWLWFGGAGGGVAFL